MTARMTMRRGNDLHFSFWLIFGSDGTMRMTRSKPSTSHHERTMAMEAVLPLALFRTPELKGRIAVADPGTEPIEINLEAAADALRQTLGVDVELHVKHPEAANG